MQRKHWKRAIAATLTSLATTALGAPMLLGQTGESALSIPAGLQNMSSADAGPLQYLPFAHFNIPFEVDPSGPLPREVHLWVSPDRGRSWLKYASTTPDKRSFEFHAAAEGEYLFAVQTRDSQGESALAASPPMRVMIDTTQPELQLSVDVSPAGQLVIDYQISDPYFSDDSVQLAFSVDGQGEWQSLRTGGLGRNGDRWIGRTEVDMPRCRELDVRLTATDMAQNKAERVFHFSAPRTAAANAGMQLASQRGDYSASAAHSWLPARPSQPLPSAQGSPHANAGVSHQAPALGNRPAAASSRAPASSPSGSGQASPGLIASQGGVDWNPSATVSSRSMSGWGQPAKSDGGARLAAAPAHGYEELPPPMPVEDASAEPSYAEPSSGDELQLSNSAPGNSATENAAGRQLPVSRREVANIELNSPGAAPKTASSAPALDAAPSLNIERPASAAAGDSYPTSAMTPSASPVAPQSSGGLSADAGSVASVPPTSSKDAYHSRSRTFSLDYAVDSLRGAAVSDIELWGTEDEGRTWQKWGSDPDRQSPFDVQVGNDGLFGFRMVVIGSNGLVSNRPELGDPADMWINVDTQIPSVHITRALYGEGVQVGSLVIEFTGTDDNLHDRPVTLSYSERPSGPWVTIASGLSASGQYVWKSDASLPRQVFLRAQAVDRAGNTQEHRLEMPVNLRGMAPQGRIQGFRPISE